MTPEEADQYIINARRVLPRWMAEIAGLSGEAKGEAQAARDTVLETLMEIESKFPSKREKTQRIARDYQYGLWATPSEWKG